MEILLRDIQSTCRERSYREVLEDISSFHTQHILLSRSARGFTVSHIPRTPPSSPGIPLSRSIPPHPSLHTRLQCSLAPHSSPSLVIPLSPPPYTSFSILRNEIRDGISKTSSETVRPQRNSLPYRITFASLMGMTVFTGNTDLTMFICWGFWEENKTRGVMGWELMLLPA